MGLILLENSAWDLLTTCWVCGPANPRGIGVPYYLDEDTQRVMAAFTPEPYHSATPNFAHGGLSLALLDEGMAWAVIAIARQRGVTRRSSSQFHRPIRIGHRYELACWIEGSLANELTVAGHIADERGRVCVSARAEYYIMTEDEAALAFGAT